MMAAMSRRSPSRLDVARAGHLGPLDTLRAALGAPDMKVWTAALTGLSRQGELRENDLLSALCHDDRNLVRATLELVAQPVVRGASALRGNPDDSAALDQRIVALLNGDDDIIVEAAAWALGERHTLGEDGDADRLAVESIVLALSAVATGHRDALCREAAVAAIGSIGHPLGRAPVLLAMSDKATVRRRAVIALAAFDGPEVDAALVAAGSDRDWQVRQAAEDLIGGTY